MNSEIIQGDCLKVMRGMDGGSVQCVVTSPPYWGLRDYGVEGMIGLESTLDEYVGKMVEVFREVRRVLRKDGTLWLNLGDSYAQAGGKQQAEPLEVLQERAQRKGYDVGAWGAKQTDGQGIAGRAANTAGHGLKPKDLCGVPWRVALALQADGWWLRSDIIWHKPNPMPESCTDRPTKAHEYLFLLTKAGRYFYDADAAREGAPGNKNCHMASGRMGARDNSTASAQLVGYSDAPPLYRNLRDVWTIPTESFKHAHFATYPRKLVTPCLKAGTSAKGCCPECGTPWVRVVDKERKATRPGVDNKQDDSGLANRDSGRHVTETSTVGWKPGCECFNPDEVCPLGGDPAEHKFISEPVPCTVLDPFAGSGTTGVVAKQLGLDFIGIELNPEYCEMARRRIANPEPEPEIPDVEGQMELFEGPTP